MKQKLFSLSAIICLVQILHAQSTVEYTYDNTGNRKVRQIIILKSTKVTTDSSQLSASGKTNTENGTKKFEETDGDKKIVIYPNPTHGQLQVELQGYDDKSPMSVQVYNLAGKIVLDQKPTNNPFAVNLALCPNGTYILKIMINNKVSEWKILKE